MKSRLLGKLCLSHEFHSFPTLKDVSDEFGSDIYNYGFILFLFIYFCFHVFSIVNNAIMNVGMQMSLQHTAFISIA